MTTTTPDHHGNVEAREGCDRCPCGAKYWENDRCVSCGEKFQPTEHHYLIGKWATINGVFCYVRDVYEENGEEFLAIHKSGREYTKFGGSIETVTV